MTLERTRPVIERLLEPIVGVAIRLGLGPNVVSVLGFLVATVAAAAFYAGGTVATEWYLLAGILVALSGILDLLDGAMARRLDITSDRGDLLDHTLDRYADIVLVGGLAAAVGEFLLGFLAITGVLLTSYLGTQAQAIGYGRLYAGALGRSDRMALIGLVGLLMAGYSQPLLGFTLVEWLLILFAVAGHLTAVQRFVVVWRGLA